MPRRFGGRGGDAASTIRADFRAEDASILFLRNAGQHVTVTAVRRRWSRASFLPRGDNRRVILTTNSAMFLPSVTTFLQKRQNKYAAPNSDNHFFLARQRPPTPQWAMASSFTRFPDNTRQSVGLLWTGDQPVAATSTWQHTFTHNRQTSFSPCVITTLRKR